MWPKANLLYFGVIFMVMQTVSTKPSKDTSERADSTKNANTKNEEFPEEDSDMLMEPNDFSPITILRSQERQYHELPTSHFRPLLVNTRHIARADVTNPTRLNSPDSHSQAAQNYYPPFFREAPPLGHSRPYFSLTDGGALVPKFAEIRPNDGNLVAHQRSLGYDQSVLGSGDFGVIRGGTFYPEEEIPYHNEDSIDFVQKYTYPEEQFAHFRDFADINTPVDSAFSQFVVVYQAKNSTANNGKIQSHPKNIFEQLELLDKEKAAEQTKLKKISQPSKTKTKLAKTKMEQKKYKKKSMAKDVEDEPLLALS
ncbi:uncharacterized protein LOC119637333 [Glossina fuscipes]|uniref:Uncharacterized protein LOC119637333 n=1 Tax=Glossina fuscipes TaxID=7396 RepID=A0A9C5YWW5_9MUSC|nr:uncharacterized protein LOC119637333 [Glossina fuscipes]XP_037889236.1 uncharacterized protein LOC119637333 [Glossina fuscipes]XP_037889244.1 uncharacterized protein LOC119637333 [Glossina fuscipes]